MDSFGLSFWYLLYNLTFVTSMPSGTPREQFHPPPFNQPWGATALASRGMRVWPPKLPCPRQLSHPPELEEQMAVLSASKDLLQPTSHAVASSLVIGKPEEDPQKAETCISQGPMHLRPSLLSVADEAI